jgi:hypothetical protein
MWLSDSPWCLMWDAYCNVLTSRPVATKWVTGMVGTLLGDMVAQATQGLLASHAKATGRRSSSSSKPGSSSSSRSMAEGGYEVDLGRTARLVGFSAIVGTPVAFVWFSLLDQVRNGGFVWTAWSLEQEMQTAAVACGCVPLGVAQLGLQPGAG